MQFTKRALCALTMPYALGAVQVRGERCVIAATEDHGPVLISRPPYREATTMVPGPGGCMALIPEPGRPGEVLAVMGCFLGYKFRDGGVYRIRPRLPDAWEATRVAALPFGHRIEVVERPSGRYLIAAALASDKESPEDWTRPGAVYAGRLPAERDGAFELSPVLSGIHRNHGLVVAPLRGRRTVFVSGAEGLFALDLEEPGEGWDWSQLLRREISETALGDVDGDGAEELLTIEPFHGDSLNLYKLASGEWRKAWSTELSFGHCLWVGLLDGKPTVLVSNRSGGRELLLFRFAFGLEGDPLRVCVDSGNAAANMIVVEHNSADHIFATNQASGEVSVYTTSP